MRKYGYIAALIVLTAILQPTLLFSLGITHYMPDLVAIIVAAQAFTRNLRLAAGFALFAGVVVDLVSPTAGLFGISSASYLVIALVVNHFVQAPHSTAWKPVLVAAISPAVAVVIRGLILLVTLQPASYAQLGQLLSWQLISGLIFAAFFVPVIDLLDRPLYRDSLPLRVGL